MNLPQMYASDSARLSPTHPAAGDPPGLGPRGPLSSEALTGYQSDTGLYTTAAIDEPTLDSLGMGS